MLYFLGLSKTVSSQITVCIKGSQPMFRTGDNHRIRREEEGKRFVLPFAKALVDLGVQCFMVRLLTQAFWLPQSQNTNRIPLKKWERPPRMNSQGYPYIGICRFEGFE